MIYKALMIDNWETWYTQFIINVLKSDMIEVKNDIVEMKGDIHVLKSDVSVLKIDMKDLRQLQVQNMEMTTQLIHSVAGINGIVEETIKIKSKLKN